MKVGAIIQARMNSSRLPGKVLLDLNGKSVLERVVDRVSCSKMIDEIVVATSSSLNDTKISKFCKSKKISYIKGSEHDVLSRFYDAAKLFKISNIIRITADCPMIDYTIIDKAIKIFASKEFDYVSNVDERSFPDGLDVEIFTYSALEKSMKLANEPFHREHVTTYIRGISGYSKGEFKKFCLKNSEDLSHIRWTLDTKKDYYHIKKFFEELEDNFSWLDALKLENKINYTE